MLVISIKTVTRILVGVGALVLGGCNLSVEEYSAQYCPEGQHFSPVQASCIDGFLDCTDCTQNNECGSKLCDLMLGKCVPVGVGVMNAQMCIPPTTSSTTPMNPGKKLGDPCTVVPNDPSCPADSMCGYITANNMNQYGISPTVCRVRGLQFFHELGTCSVLFLTGAGGASYTTTEAAAQLPNDRVLDIPGNTTAVLLYGCGVDASQLFAFGYNSSNIAVKTPVSSAIKLSSNMGITVNGGTPRTQGLLFQVNSL